MKEEEDKCENGHLSVTTPLGSFVSRGKRNAELVASMALIVMGIQLYLVYTHIHDARVSAQDMTVALKNFSLAQREMTCILSLPQEKREIEYQSPRGLCKRMVELQ